MKNMQKEHATQERHSASGAAGIIFSQRAFLMGISMLGIMLLHQTYLPGEYLLPFSLFGQYGADVFIFVSGMGIASSLSRNSLYTFYENRFIRLLPAWLLVGLVAGIADMTFFGGNLLGIPKWLTQRWFLNALVCLYLISPLLKAFIERFGFRGVLLMVALIELLLVYYCTPGSVLRMSPYLDYYLLTCTLRRIPAYVIGMYMVMGDTRLVEKWSRCACFSIILFLIVCTARLVQVEYLSLGDFEMSEMDKRLIGQLPYPLLALALPWACTLISKWSSRFSSLHLWRFFAGFMGALSLELYLCHVWVFPKTMLLLTEHAINGWLCLIAALLASGMFAWVTHKVCAKLIPSLKQGLQLLKR